MFWKKGLNRVIMFWFTALTMTIVVSTAIGTDYLDWDRISRDFMPTNELSRACLASFILVMDLMIVMQVRQPIMDSQSECALELTYSIRGCIPFFKHSCIIYLSGLGVPSLCWCAGRQVARSQHGHI